MGKVNIVQVVDPEMAVQVKLLGEHLDLLVAVMKSLTPGPDNPEPFAIRTVSNQIPVGENEIDVIVSFEFGHVVHEVLEALDAAKPHLSRIQTLVGHVSPPQITLN